MGRNLEYDQHICTQRRYLGHFRPNLNIVRVFPRPPSSHVDTLPHVADRGRRAGGSPACSLDRRAARQQTARACSTAASGWRERRPDRRRSLNLRRRGGRKEGKTEDESRSNSEAALDVGFSHAGQKFLVFSCSTNACA